MTKGEILKLAKGNFKNILPLIEIREIELKATVGWLEVHCCDSQKCSLNEFLLSSLRHVKFWEYEKGDQDEFENDISKGKFKRINIDDAQAKYRIISSMYESENLKVYEDTIPKNLDSFKNLKFIYSIYDEWNNQCITLITESQYKNIFFGHSE